MPPLVKPPTTEEIEQALKNGIAANPEIGDALKEFEVQNKAFENKINLIDIKRGGAQLSRFLLEHSFGLVKNEHQANIVILFFTFMLFILSIIIFNLGVPKNNEAMEEIIKLHPEMFRK
jgi:hypothetical protein